MSVRIGTCLVWKVLWWMALGIYMLLASTWLVSTFLSDPAWVGANGDPEQGRVAAISAFAVALPWSWIAVGLGIFKAMPFVTSWWLGMAGMVVNGYALWRIRQWLQKCHRPVQGGV